jgi:hypothetical protein
VKPLEQETKNNFMEANLLAFEIIDLPEVIVFSTTDTTDNGCH